MSQATADHSFQIALQHHQAGQLSQAEGLYRQILAQQPNHARAIHMLGILAHQVGRNEAAVDCFRRAIALNPNWPEAHYNFASVLKARGQLDEAIAAYRQAIALKSDWAEAHNNLGNALKERGQLDEAIAAYRQAIALKSDYADASNNLGNALKDVGRLDEAEAAYRRAIVLKSNFPEAYSNLAAILQGKGKLQEAIDACRQAIVLRPNYSEAHVNLGNALSDMRRLDEAVAAYRKAISLKPDYAEAHFNLGLSLLLQGNFAQGWKEHEWRWRCKDFPSRHRNFAQPQWDGSDLAGRTILLHADQGFGDTIQFIRYIPLVTGRGGRAVVGCAPELIRLLRPMPGVAQCLVWGESLPAFDVYCPLSSLPAVFETTLANIPQSVPYLQADSGDVERWRKELAGDSNRLKIGLTWAAGPTHDNHKIRSIPFAALAPLAQVPGISFYSLQKGEAARQTNDPAPSSALIDQTDELKDFGDTAALIENLDLVISVDTAVAHLAGAMGKRVWTLLPFLSDWRWPIGRQDSLWYPTMRLFRQASSIEGWEGVIQQLAESLRLVFNSG